MVYIDDLYELTKAFVRKFCLYKYFEDLRSIIYKEICFVAGCRGCKGKTSIMILKNNNMYVNIKGSR